MLMCVGFTLGFGLELALGHVHVASEPVVKVVKPLPSSAPAVKRFAAWASFAGQAHAWSCIADGPRILCSAVAPGAAVCTASCTAEGRDCYWIVGCE